MSVRYCVEMSVGYAIRMSAQVAQGDLGIWIAYTETRGGIAALAVIMLEKGRSSAGAFGKS